jgi:hypothetical protein
MDYAVIDETGETAIGGPLADKNNEQLMGTAWARSPGKRSHKGERPCETLNLAN